MRPIFGSVRSRRRADIGVVPVARPTAPEADQQRRIGRAEEQGERAAPPRRPDQRGERGIAQRGGDDQPDRAGGEPRPARPAPAACRGRSPPPCRRESPARPGRDGRGTRRARQAAPHPRRPAQRATSTATPPLPASSTSVSAAAGRLPVRSTLVAPMLPEPILRRSPRPKARAITIPNGTEPSR